MSKTNRIEITTREEVGITSKKSETTIRIEEPDINELLTKINKEDLISFIQSERFKPADIFEEEELIEWANGNGYVKE